MLRKSAPILMLLLGILIGWAATTLVHKLNADLNAAINASYASNSSDASHHHREFEDFSELEIYLEQTLENGDYRSFQEAIDDTNIPDRASEQSNDLMLTLFDSLATLKPSNKIVLNYSDLQENELNVQRNTTQWASDSYIPKKWNYTPEKIILYQYSRPQNSTITISVGIVQRNGKFVIVSSY